MYIEYVTQSYNIINYYIDVNIRFSSACMLCEPGSGYEPYDSRV